MTYLPTDFLNYTQWDDPNKDGILMFYIYIYMCSNLMAILAQLLQSLFPEVESLVIIFYLSTITSTTISR